MEKFIDFCAQHIQDGTFEECLEWYYEENGKDFLAQFSELELAHTWDNHFFICDECGWVLPWEAVSDEGEFTCASCSE